MDSTEAPFPLHCQDFLVFLSWLLRIHWRLSRILKTNKKNVWTNVFWYVRYIFNTLYIMMKQMLKSFPLNKINGPQNALFFLSRAPTRHSFTFDLRFSYELKHKVRISNTVCEIFHFRFRFYVIILFKIKIREKSQALLLPHLWFLGWNKKFWIPTISAWAGAPQKLTWRQIFSA